MIVLLAMVMICISHISMVKKNYQKFQMLSMHLMVSENLDSMDKSCGYMSK